MFIIFGSDVCAGMICWVYWNSPLQTINSGLSETTYVKEEEKNAWIIPAASGSWEDFFGFGVCSVGTSVKAWRLSRKKEFDFVM